MKSVRFFIMPIGMNDGTMFHYTGSITFKCLATFISHINRECFNPDLRNEN